jgi:hypothetical protein
VPGEEVKCNGGENPARQREHEPVGQRLDGAAGREERTREEQQADGEEDELGRAHAASRLGRGRDEGEEGDTDDEAGVSHVLEGVQERRGWGRLADESRPWLELLVGPLAPVHPVPDVPVAAGNRDEGRAPTGVELSVKSADRFLVGGVEHPP